MTFELTGTALLLSIVGITLLIGIVIFTVRYMVKSRSEENLADKYRGHEWESPLYARNKFPDVNVFKYSGVIFRFGMALSILVILLAFSWTQYDTKAVVPQDAMEVPEEIEIEPPRTKKPPPPPPPPPPPKIEEVPEEDIEEDPPEFKDQTVEEETFVDEPEEEAPPPPPPPPEPEVEEIFKVVEQMPRFPGCEDIDGTEQEKKQCAEKKMLQFIYDNIEYPAIARENGVEGVVVVSFVVDKDGTIEDPKIVRNIGAGCGEEALRIVKLMNEMDQNWTPGRQRGRAVKVRFTLPIRFRLE